MMPAVRFEDRLAAVREAFGASLGEKMTHTRFAGLLLTEASTYGRYERGECLPPCRTLAAIQRVTGTDLNVLICGPKLTILTGAAMSITEAGFYWARLKPVGEWRVFEVCLFMTASGGTPEVRSEGFPHSIDAYEFAPGGPLKLPVGA